MHRAGDCGRGDPITALENREFVSIQYLRGIAASAVVFKHASHPGGALELMLDAGVDLFFVISGFVMVVSTAGRDMTPAMFMLKRCRRVLPMWWLTLCLVALLGLGTGGLGAFLLSFPLIPYTIEMSKSAVFWGVGWTLVLEAVFYAYFAIGLAMKSDRFIFLAIPLAVAAGLFVGRPDNPVLNAAVTPFLLEFVMGAAVGRVIVSGVKPPLLLLPLGMALFVVGAHGPGAWAYLVRALTIGLPLALIVAALATARMPRVPALKLVGDASYSIYLLHYAVIMLAWQVVPQNSYWPVTATLAIGGAVAAYLLVEKPLLTALKKGRAPSPLTAPL